MSKAIAKTLFGVCSIEIAGVLRGKEGGTTEIMYDDIENIFSEEL